MTTLPIVYDGVQQPEIDIVSIPGLPSLTPQYKVREHNTWLREVLSHKIPKARIMSFQYDFGKHATSLSWVDLLANVDKLLYALVHRRENSSSRPIIFVCYSFGAVILKKALLIAKERLDFNNIIDRTGGIVFLGCLHDESSPMAEMIALKCAAVEFGTNLKHAAIDALKKSDGWSRVKEVMEQFRYLQSPFPIRIFYELKVSSLEGRGWTMKKSKPEVLVSEPLSMLGWGDERLIGVQRDHASFLSYPHRGDKDDFFPVLMKTLTELVDFVCVDQGDQNESALDNMPPASHLSPGITGRDQLWSLVTNLSTSTDLNLDPLGDDISVNAESVVESLAQDVHCFVLDPYEENSSFVGREDTLNDIHRALDPTGSPKKQRTFVLSGLGGMGKTQIAIKYSFRYRETYRIVLWAHADGEAKLAESFNSFAVALGLGSMSSPIKAKAAVKDFLKGTNEPWLMIFDNADGENVGDLLRSFWPAAQQGSVLITSRDHTLVNQFPGMILTELEEKSAVHLLFELTSLNRARMPTDVIEEERNAAKIIVKRVGYLPLGIFQAVMLIVHDSCRMVEFLEAYSLRELIADSDNVQLINTSTAYQYSLTTVWNINYDRLGDQARELINLLSFLDPDRIQMQVLKDGTMKVAANTATNQLFGSINTAYKLNKGRSALLKSGLVSQSEDRHELRMHRLVQASCQLRMTVDERRRNFQAAIVLIVATWPVPNREAIHDPSLWDTQRSLLPHVQRLCAEYNESQAKGISLLPADKADWKFVSLLYEAGWFCFESGLLSSIDELLQTAKKYGLEHLHEGGGYRIMADVHGGLGAYEAEINEFQKAYDDFHQEWIYVQEAVEHGELQRPSIWWVFALGRMGNGLGGLQRFAEGVQYYREMFVEWDKLPGDQKMYKSHMATSLWLQGRLDEAEATVRAVIKDFNDTSNLRTAVAMFSLGNIRTSQAEAAALKGEKQKSEEIFDEAMKLHLQVRIMWTKVLGARHHRTADAIYKVGWHFHRLRDYDRAITFLEDACSVFEDNPKYFRNEIARTKYKLGCAYQDKGDDEKGGKLIREAEELRQQILPPEEWEPANGEADFDKIVQFWSR